MNPLALDTFVNLDPKTPIWDRVYTIAPLVIIGSKEGDSYDLAPKHMAAPMGFDNYFGFVCTPDHKTYHNIRQYEEFTVSFPNPDQVLMASLTASNRKSVGNKTTSVLDALEVAWGHTVDAPVVAGCYLYLECALHRIVDGFGTNALITGYIHKAYVDEDLLRVSEIDEGDQIARHPLLAYIANGRFAKIEQTFNFPFPKDFSK
ncbi:MAG: flavin reductase [Bacteroidia bacterium]|nr:flavin reductase [Bacteroidia bacterium]